MRTFTIVVSEDPESDTYMADVPALPGCHTWGKTKAEAFRRAKDAIETYLEVALEQDWLIAREVGQKVATVEE